MENLFMMTNKRDLYRKLLKNSILSSSVPTIVGSYVSSKRTNAQIDRIYSNLPRVKHLHVTIGVKTLLMRCEYCHNRFLRFGLSEYLGGKAFKHVAFCAICLGNNCNCIIQSNPKLNYEFLDSAKVIKESDLKLKP